MRLTACNGTRTVKMEMKIVEIRINPFDDLTACMMCNASSSDPDWGASGKPHRPELFMVDLGQINWICTFCARNYAPALADLILMARAAKQYARLIFDRPGAKHPPEAPETINNLAIRI